MRRLIVVAMLTLLAACRGEPVPRDYQNAPPDMTSPPDNAAEAPSSATVQSTPEPTSGAEGKAAPYEPVTPPADQPTTTIPDTPPTSTT